MAAEWYYSKGDEQHGPISSKQLKELVASGELLPSDNIWKEGMENWQPAVKLKGLFLEPSSESPSPPPLPPIHQASPSPRMQGKENPNSKALVIGGAVLGLFILIGLSGGFDGDSGSTGSSGSKQEPEIRITAEELLREYEANEVAADEKYKGHLLEVTGTIERIGKDVLDNHYVALKSGNQYDFRSVQCFFSDSSGLAKLSPGQRISTRGRCDGLFGTVQIEDCEMVD